MKGVSAKRPEGQKRQRKKHTTQKMQIAVIFFPTAIYGLSKSNAKRISALG